MHMFGGYGLMGYGGMGMIFMFLFWGGIIALVIFSIRQGTRKASPEYQETPVEIVKNRYARGEISREEFDRIISELK